MFLLLNDLFISQNIKGILVSQFMIPLTVSKILRLSHDLTVVHVYMSLSLFILSSFLEFTTDIIYSLVAFETEVQALNKVHMLMSCSESSNSSGHCY